MGETNLLGTHGAENNRLVPHGTRLYNREVVLRVGQLRVGSSGTGGGILGRRARRGGMFNAEKKVVPISKLSEWRREMRQNGTRLVVTNGCFDLLHAGHVRYLEQARNLGDALLVGLNGDESVRALKGKDRPINPEADRALVLAALGCIDGVCIFPEKRAHRFLALAAPDQYVKGGDYTVDTLDPDERRAVETCGGEIVILSFVSGQSTTATLQRISEAERE